MVSNHCECHAARHKRLPSVRSSRYPDDACPAGSAAAPESRLPPRWPRSSTSELPFLFFRAEVYWPFSTQTKPRFQFLPSRL
jgi:hypothetical protein